MPGHTSAWVFSQIHDCMELLRAENTEISMLNQIAAPAATIQTLINGATCATLPSHLRWVHAYNSNNEMKLLINLIRNPLTIQYLRKR